MERSRLAATPTRSDRDVLERGGGAIEVTVQNALAKGNPGETDSVAALVD